MTIPYYKAHGAGNDFLFTFAADLAEPISEAIVSELAVAICQRNTGVGADGWYLIDPPARIRLWNSDGSKAELSGNGTRCAAALLVERGMAKGNIRIETGAGAKELRLIRREGQEFYFQMDMGEPMAAKSDLRYPLPLAGGVREAAIVDVGNPQCAIAVDDLNFDWISLGAEVEGHVHFPRRTNVSFFRKTDDHTIEARFYERGAGATKSSGTGSAGAAVAAMMLGLVESPVTVRGECGELEVGWVSRSGAIGPIYLTGPARIISKGEFYW